MSTLVSGPYRRPEAPDVGDVEELQILRRFVMDLGADPNTMIES